DVPPNFIIRIITPPAAEHCYALPKRGRIPCSEEDGESFALLGRTSRPLREAFVLARRRLGME
ncbi:MAG: hypothetical protein ACK42I_04690, partial [Thermomicrobium sp.]